VHGETLAGLLRAQDVSHFHGIAQFIQNIDEANAKKREVEAAQAAEAKASEETPNIEPAANPGGNTRRFADPSDPSLAAEPKLL
jgi:hypothetical protein